MALTEAQIMAAVYKKVDGVGDAIAKARSDVDELCEDMPGTFTRAAHSALARGIRGKLIVKEENKEEAKPKSLRQVGGAVG